MSIKNFTDLTVWKKSHSFVLKIYKCTGEFPETEKFGLTSQMRRAAISVPANIAEGFRKRGKRDKANFYNIAQGSVEEVKYYLILSSDLGYMKCSQGLMDEADEISRMLYSLIESIS